MQNSRFVRRRITETGKLFYQIFFIILSKFSQTSQTLTVVSTSLLPINPLLRCVILLSFCIFVLGNQVASERITLLLSRIGMQSLRYK